MSGSHAKTCPPPQLIQSSFSSRSSQHHKSQMVGARKLTFWENVHGTPCVMCHLQRVTCHLSLVTCHLLHFTCHLSYLTFFQYIFLFIKKKIWQICWASWWRVCYQRGLARLVIRVILTTHALNIINPYYWRQCINLKKILRSHIGL